MISSSVTSSAQRVERSERSLVHSDARRGACVTRPTAGCARRRCSRGHALMPRLRCLARSGASAWNSTESCVSSMNASSSDAVCGLSS